MVLARVVPTSCDSIVATYNSHCLGMSSLQDLGNCLSKNLDKSSTEQCNLDYNKYLKQVEMSKDKLVAKDDSTKQFVLFNKQPIMTPVQVEMKISGIRNRCKLVKRGFGRVGKQLWSNLVSLLNFSIQFIHWIIYLSLALMYAVPALVLTTVLTFPFIVSREYFSRFGCMLGNMMEFFMKYTKYIAPWNVWRSRVGGSINSM